MSIEPKLSGRALEAAGAEGLEPVAHALGEWQVVHHVVEARLVVAGLELRARGQGRRLRAVHEAADELVEIVAALGAHVEAGYAALGDNVRRLTALGDDPVHAGVGPHLLAERGDAVEGQDHRVEGVEAVPRRGRGCARASP